MDSAGRLVIPKALRDEAGLEPGAPVVVRVADGKIEMEPAPEQVRLVRRGPLLVAVRRRSGPRLTNAVVQSTRKRLHAERAKRR
jgi:AbrB family looped-hinge helix DNA binding protein